MSATRYSEGGVTITLGDELAGLANRIIDASSKGPAIRTLQRAAEQVATKARADWYAPATGVMRDTGKSGDIQVVTTITPSEVRVSIGSTDTRTSGGRPLASYIHRPGRTESLFAEPRKARTLTDAEKEAASRRIRAAYDNPKTARDGKFLLPELVIKPARVKLAATIPEMSAAFAAQIGGPRA